MREPEVRSDRGVIMETRKIAIACQGGGMHRAFTCGVLTAILRAKEEELRGRAKGSRRRFEVVGLSGTSAGALNAFMVWCGLMSAAGGPERFAQARQKVNDFWDTFQARRRGEQAMNTLAQQFYKWNELGVSVRPPLPPYFYDWLVAALEQWSAIEGAFAPHMDLGEVRPEFYDFLELLRACAPELADLRRRLGEIATNKQTPRLLLGAVEILSGRFEAFDSWADPDSGRNISYEAVAASGTLPEFRRAQRIAGLKNEDGRESLYWDGVFSQNPPVREFAAGTDKVHTPDEIWVIRINPQRRDEEPVSLATIEDRRNELAGNLSLNQELRFIEKVNEWIASSKSAAKGRARRPDQGVFSEYKPIRIHVITMAKDRAELGIGSKFDRSAEFVRDMRAHGEARGGAFLPLWLSDSKDLVAWPDGDALDVMDRH